MLKTTITTMTQTAHTVNQSSIMIISLTKNMLRQLTNRAMTNMPQCANQQERHQ